MNVRGEDISDIGTVIENECGNDYPEFMFQSIASNSVS